MVLLGSMKRLFLYSHNLSKKCSQKCFKNFVPIKFLNTLSQGLNSINNEKSTIKREWYNKIPDFIINLRLMMENLKERAI